MSAFDPKHERLLRLFTACVLGRWDVATALRLAAAEGEPDRAWRETVLQTHVFAGFPRTVEAFSVLEAAGGLGAFAPDELHGVTEPVERGRDLFERIYADNAPKVRGVLERAHPDFAAWIESHAYGRVLSRPGLTPAFRELLAVAALAALGQDRQLASHARGAVRCGATPTDVSRALNSIRDLLDPARYARAHDVITHFARE